MDMFTREEAFSFIKTKLQIENAEERIKTDKRTLLDDIIVAVHEHIPFHNLKLLSIPFEERRAPTKEEIKSDFVSGIGGLCFTINTSTFYLLKAIGFDATMAHGTCTTSVAFRNNHILLYVSNVEIPGDKFLVEVAVGLPTFQAINMDFEKESPIFVSSYLEYKFVKHDGKILRMHRKGDQLANRKREQTELDFWIGDFRRFYEADVEGSTDFLEFDKYNKDIFTNPAASPFHRSHRFINFKGKRTSMVISGKTLNENDNGQLESKEIPGGDDGIVSIIRKICPCISEDIIHKSLYHWRLTTSS